MDSHSFVCMCLALLEVVYTYIDDPMFNPSFFRLMSLHCFKDHHLLPATLIAYCLCDFNRCTARISRALASVTSCVSTGC
ncbi:hypothetical protein DN757_28150 [Paenibacillus silvae]|uniref:Uncharacterized protein n=1 Tax=Paenibacillus silvae TaxID=1325358 RepID=A0A2W6NXZ4_9BACL|nr:hypothetical protein DN757_28150 [Paenibacillus silvae]